jgi:hypothetical protein
MIEGWIRAIKIPQDGRLVLKDREETLIEVLATPWDFECTVHGVQRALPLEATRCRRNGIEIHERSSNFVLSKFRQTQ